MKTAGPSCLYLFQDFHSRFYSTHKHIHVHAWTWQHTPHTQARKSENGRRMLTSLKSLAGAPTAFFSSRYACQSNPFGLRPVKQVLKITQCLRMLKTAFFSSRYACQSNPFGLWPVQQVLKITQCLCMLNSPWHNCNGWLGIKHQVTATVCVCWKHTTKVPYFSDYEAILCPSNLVLVPLVPICD